MITPALWKEIHQVIDIIIECREDVMDPVIQISDKRKKEVIKKLEQVAEKIDLLIGSLSYYNFCNWTSFDKEPRDSYLYTIMSVPETLDTNAIRKYFNYILSMLIKILMMIGMDKDDYVLKKFNKH